MTAPQPSGTGSAAAHAALTPHSLAAQVAEHYDELDRFYRRLWGEHVHHGLWATGREDRRQAVVQLLELIAARADLREGSVVCDAGCGYGATGRWLWERYHAVVTGYTLSPVQHEHAVCRQPPGHRHVHGDWLDNREPAATYDCVIAVESTEHMVGRQRVAQEALRLLRPGGRFAIAAWLSARRLRPWQRHHLLDPICRGAVLAGALPTDEEWRSTLIRTGFTDVTVDLIGPSVRRTWTLLTRAVLVELLRPSSWRYLLDATNRHRQFAITVFRMELAYRVGALNYGIIAGQKRIDDRAPPVGRARNTINPLRYSLFESLSDRDGKADEGISNNECRMSNDLF